MTIPVDSRETATVDVGREAVQARLDTLLARCYADGQHDEPDFTERTKEAAYDLLTIISALHIALEEARSSATARDEALASIRVFAQDCIENGYFDKGALGNLYSIRDLCDSEGEKK